MAERRCSTEFSVSSDETLVSSQFSVADNPGQEAKSKIALLHHENPAETLLAAAGGQREAALWVAIKKIPPPTPSIFFRNITFNCTIDQWCGGQVAKRCRSPRKSRRNFSG